MTTRLLMLTLSVLLLTACAPAPTMRSGVVFDHAKDEVLQAAAERRSTDAAEKALMPPLAVEMPQTGEVEPRFDLSVVNASASQVFMALVTGTRYNMLVNPEVTGQITVRLKDVTVRDALESIRELYGYEFTIKGNRISIQPNTLQTRVFQVNYLASKRQGATELRVTSGSNSSSGGSGGTGSTTGTGTNATNQPSNQPSNQSGNQGGGSLGSLTSRVHTTTDSDFWGGLTTALTTIIGSEEGRNVVVSPQSGVIVIRALPRELRAVESYLKATQTIIERQVVLEAKIIDVTLSQDYQSGINWGAFKSGPNSQSGIGAVGPNTYLKSYNPGNVNVTQGYERVVATDGTVSYVAVPSGYAPTAAAASAANLAYSNQALISGSSSAVTPGQFGSIVASSLGKGFFGLAFQTANFAALLNFLETQGSVSVLSSPRIATLNNQKAVLKVGTDDLFVTNITGGTTATTTTSGTAPTVTLQSYFSGISLDVTPQIDDDNNIILHIHPAVSSVTEKEKTINLGTTGTFTLPLASSSVNETDSIVRAKDGNIIAIGGLMRQDQTVGNTQLPGASNAGPASALLGQRSNSMSKRELVILLKPTVITDERTWVKEISDAGDRMRSLDPQQFNLDKK